MNIRKKARSTSPSARDTTFSEAPSISISAEQNHSTSEERMTNGISFESVERPTPKGITRAVQPVIISILKIFEPTTLPMAIPELPLSAETMLITSSGAEVPKATIVRPITRSLTPQRRARSEAPSVSQLAPKSINASPTIRYT